MGKNETTLKSSSDKKASFDNLTFKQGMDLLEETVNKLESGDLELEQSLEEYALGVSLLANLEQRLENAEQKVEVLMGNLERGAENE